MVTIQADTIRPATLQRTTVRGQPPTPRWSPSHTWVVDNEYPEVAGRQDRRGRGRLGRHALGGFDLGQALAHRPDDPPPPDPGPEAIAKAHETITHTGVAPLLSVPLLTRAKVMTPMVF